MEWCEKAFPEIPWREPIFLRTRRNEGYWCRICLALREPKDEDLIYSLTTLERVQAHLAEAHPDA